MLAANREKDRDLGRSTLDYESNSLELAVTGVGPRCYYTWCSCGIIIVAEYVPISGFDLRYPGEDLDWLNVRRPWKLGDPGLHGERLELIQSGTTDCYCDQGCMRLMISTI